MASDPKFGKATPLSHGLPRLHPLLRVESSSTWNHPHPWPLTAAHRSADDRRYHRCAPALSRSRQCPIGHECHCCVGCSGFDTPEVAGNGHGSLRKAVMGLESLHFTSAALWDSSTASSAVGAVGSANPRTRYDALEIHRLARVTSHPLKLSPGTWCND